MQASQVEQSCSSYFTSSHQLDFLDRWRQQRKNTLYTDLVRYFSDSESLTVCVYVFTLDHNALELLNTLFVTLTDSNVYVYSITSLESRKRGALVSRVLLDEFN